MYRVNDVVVNGQRIPNVFNTQDKDFHAKYTRPIGVFWTLSKVLELEPVIDETIDEFLARVQLRFVDDAGRVCMMDDWVTYFAWDVAANVSFGRTYGFIEEERDVEGIIAESTAGLKYFAPLSQIPWLDNWLDKNPVWRIGPRPLVKGFSITVQKLTEYQQQLAAGEAKPKPVDLFIDRYNGLKETHPDFVDDAQVINWLMLNVLAGGDSTAGAMRSVIYHLARNPGAQAKLQAELDAAGVRSPAQWADIGKLPYLDAVMRESQRASPALGLMLEREVPAAGFQLPDGRVIPANTKVGLNPCVVNHDKGVFGDDVEAFRPERWFKRGDESDDAFSLRLRRMQEAADLMFGSGTRICMGKHLAKLITTKLIASLYATYSVSRIVKYTSCFVTNADHTSQKVQLKDPNHTWTYFNAWFMYQSDMPMIIVKRK
jgi:cytochrome P450